MLTHEEEFGLSPKRTSSIMLTLLWVKEGAIRQESLPLLLKTHIVLLLFIFQHVSGTSPILLQTACQKHILLIINNILIRQLFRHVK